MNHFLGLASPSSFPYTFNLVLIIMKRVILGDLIAFDPIENSFEFGTLIMWNLDVYCIYMYWFSIPLCSKKFIRQMTLKENFFNSIVHVS